MRSTPEGASESEVMARALTPTAKRCIRIVWPLPRYAGEEARELHLLQNVHRAGAAGADDVGEADLGAGDLA